MVAAMRGLIRDGTAPAEIAVLVRMNAQIEPIEAALTEAGLAYQVRGVRFYDRPEVKGAISSLRRPGLEATGLALLERGPAAMGRRGRVRGGRGVGSEGREAQERQSSLETLLDIVTSVVRATPSARCGDVSRRAGPPRRPRAGGRRRRRQPPDLPPGEGARVGRGVPADARGGLAADPPGARRRGRPGRGAAPALRRDHAGPRPPRALVGRAARDARPGGSRRRAEPVRAGSSRTRPRPRPRRPAGPARPGAQTRRRRRPGLRGPPRVARGRSPATRACPPT